jgi:hypothetical protein
MRKLLIILGSGAAVLLLQFIITASGCPKNAHAQVVPGGCVCVSDPPVELATAQIAASVTTPGGGGDYQPNAPYIASLDQGLFSGVNSQNFNSEFPGWQALPPDSTDTIAIPLVATVLQTYAQALALAQSQQQELEGEDFTNISTVSSATTALLTAQQANTQAVLADVQEQQYTRQLLAALITVEATKAAEELNERAQESATSALSFNFGVVP